MNDLISHQINKTNSRPFMTRGDWEPSDYDWLDSPFDMREILLSCPKLHAQWNKYPFYLDVNNRGRVVARYGSIIREMMEKAYADNG